MGPLRDKAIDATAVPPTLCNRVWRATRSPIAELYGHAFTMGKRRGTAAIVANRDEQHGLPEVP